MSVYIKTLHRLINLGYDANKALLAVYRSFGLTPEQLVVLKNSLDR